jgi:hypothetical protein
VRNNGTESGGKRLRWPVGTLTRRAVAQWRTTAVERFASVRAFVPMLCEAIEFGATAQATGILEAMTDLPGLLDARATTAIPAGYLDARRVAEDVVPAGWWRCLVYSEGRPDGTVDKAAYVFCVLEQFHRHLLRRDIYASPSARWGDPRAKLLPGPAWDRRQGAGRSTCSGFRGPRQATRRALPKLDGAWRALCDGLVAGSEVHVDADGCTPTRSTRSRSHRASLICAGAWRPCSQGSIFQT